MIIIGELVTEPINPKLALDAGVYQFCPLLSVIILVPSKLILSICEKNLLWENDKFIFPLLRLVVALFHFVKFSVIVLPLEFLFCVIPANLKLDSSETVVAL